MAATKHATDVLGGLNLRQREAAVHGSGPLLIIAGAGSGKTKTLVHRVARQIAQGVEPGRILLLTFTRRAAAEMLRRVEALLRQLKAKGGGGAGKKIWGGTFHATATRLLRMYGGAVGLDPGFTIHDRGDSEDLIDVVRTELGLAKTDKRFPKKGTCMAIYSRCVNAQQKLEHVLPEAYPWCQPYADELKQLFQAYVDRKEAGSVLDYDDLLLFWRELLAHEESGHKVRARFDCVLVDEYQDTNALQAEILKLLRPDGSGLTVVGDDAQSIYSFRAATVRNILDFPEQFPGTTVVKLEQNYRSTQPILTATNHVIADSQQRYVKELWSQRDGGEQPWLVTCEDEDEQAEFVVEKILAHREEGLQLRQQAVLFRASHHSILLEAELARRNIPFVKYGGLKFMEAAHVKDLMAFLRLAENPGDVVAGGRVLVLLPGIGPAKARDLMSQLLAGPRDFAVWAEAKVPGAAKDCWPKFVKLMRSLAGTEQPLPAQVATVLGFYEPLLQDKYDNADSRLRDLEQLEQLAERFEDRRTMLAEMALDPPTSTEDFAGDGALDEDYLVLSTIHSAKGLEWNAVYVIHASDGNIPSDMSTKSQEQIEEERRLFYVALTRAKDSLYVSYCHRFFHAYRNPYRGDFGFAKLTRFIRATTQLHFQQHVAGCTRGNYDDGDDASAVIARRRSARRRTRSLWK
jgi:DNA helicase-2/ATP-dependent DNA helicase PcrA